MQPQSHTVLPTHELLASTNCDITGLISATPAIIFGNLTYSHHRWVCTRLLGSKLIRIVTDGCRWMSTMRLCVTSADRSQLSDARAALVTWPADQALALHLQCKQHDPWRNLFAENAAMSFADIAPIILVCIVYVAVEYMICFAGLWYCRELPKINV